MAQLLVIVSDGRGLFLEGKERVMAAVRSARGANVFVIFVVLDNPNSRVGICTFLYTFFLNRYLRTNDLTKPPCPSAGLHPRHKGAHFQRTGRTPGYPFLHGRVPLPFLRHPARRQRPAGDAERRAQAVVRTGHGGRPVERQVARRKK